MRSQSSDFVSRSLHLPPLSERVFLLKFASKGKSIQVCKVFGSKIFAKEMLIWRESAENLLSESKAGKRSEERERESVLCSR